MLCCFVLFCVDLCCVVLTAEHRHLYCLKLLTPSLQAYTFDNWYVCLDIKAFNLL